MNSEAPITILMSTYNRRKFIAEAIASVRAQTLRDWRLLIVNDGGEDVADVVLGFGDERIEYFNHEHLGKAAQLNFMLSRVDGGYIGYMDDDDVMRPDHLETLYRAAREESSEFVFSDLRRVFISPAGRIVKTDVPKVPDVEFKDIRLVNAIAHPLVLHTKALADRVGPYDERLKVLIDYDYIRRMAQLVRPLHVHAVTYEYRQRLRSEALEDVDSITGIWRRDPAEAGRSVMAVFEKDPAALAELYRRYAGLDRELKGMKASIWWRITAFPRAIVRRIKRSLGR